MPKLKWIVNSSGSGAMLSLHASDSPHMPLACVGEVWLSGNTWVIHSQLSQEKWNIEGTIEDALHELEQFTKLSLGRLEVEK